MDASKAFWSNVLAPPALVVSYLLLDQPIARFFRNTFQSLVRRDLLGPSLPDLLFPIACVLTLAAWAAYLHLVRKGIHDAHTRFFQLLAITIPLSVLLKTLLKLAIGRITTRYWLFRPAAPEFRWFAGRDTYGGFPSGHMAVFTVLVLGLCVHDPRRRRIYAGALALLAVALVVTGYHFLSDVIAGAWLGLGIHLVVARFLGPGERPA
jgi:membrane-associated phospholipid phosphatase